nr:MAG TPA: hypothetical protein [Caudoviricetes sp.]
MTITLSCDSIDNVNRTYQHIKTFLKVFKKVLDKHTYV